MDVLERLSWIDLAILVLLAAGVFIGFTQGIVRYLLNVIAVLVAFGVAAQLRGPLSGAFGVWQAFPPEGRDLFFFLLLYLALAIGFWFLIRAFFSRTRLPVPGPLDEIGGAILGVLYVVVVICFLLVVLDSLYVGDRAEPIGPIGGWYTAMNDSFIVGFLRDTVIPAVGFLVRPFVPQEIAQLLVR